MRRRWGLKAIAKDLLANGYDGVISIEPHLAVVHHDPGIQAPEDIKFANYFEYGRRFMQLVEDVRGWASGVTDPGYKTDVQLAALLLASVRPVRQLSAGSRRPYLRTRRWR